MLIRLVVVFVCLFDCLLVCFFVCLFASLFFCVVDVGVGLSMVSAFLVWQGSTSALQEGLAAEA